MLRLIKITLIFFSLIGISAISWADIVEVALVDRLNGNDNNYCIDTVGAQEHATPEEGLQAYTCYSYGGSLGFDQIMDSGAIEQGQFLMTGFNVCMEAKGTTAGTTLWGTECDGGEMQDFELLSDQTIRLSSADQLCLSVGDETRFGRRGPTGHQYKDLTLEVCSEERAAYQQWYMRSSMEE